jgi:hypothetical protein
MRDGSRVTSVTGATAPFVTDEAATHAQMTLVTGVSHIDSKPPVTGDRFSQVDRYNARRRGETGNLPQPSLDPAALPLMPTDRYITDRAQLGRCRTCNHPIIRADTGQHILATVDPIQLTTLQELEHLVAGGRTYGLKPDKPQLLPGTRYLTWRSVSEIRWHPGRGLPQHDCQHPRAALDLTLLDGTLRCHVATPADPSYRHPEGIPF